MLKKYPNIVAIHGSKNKERILENLNAYHAALSDASLRELETQLDSLTVDGHRGINETQQHSFSSNWRNGETKK